MSTNGEEFHRTIYKVLLVVSALSLSSLVTAAPKPSFDCARAHTDIEKLICSSEPLAKLDRIVASEYRKFRAQLPAGQKAIAKSMQRIWIRNRGRECGNEKLEECVKKDYYQWINGISKGVLISRYRELRPGVEYTSPFDKGIKFELTVTESDGERMDGETSRNYRLDLVDGDTLHEGSYYAFGNQRSVDVVTQIVFLLSQRGVAHMALQRTYEEYGGRCGAFARHSLEFRAPLAPRAEIASITLYEEDSACDTYEKELFRWDAAENGNLVYYEIESESFYYQVPFIEIKAKEIDSPNAKVNEYYYVDKSGDAFLGVPYEQIMARIQQEIPPEGSHLKTASCQIPGYGLGDYLRLKQILSDYQLGFHQIEYFSANYLEAKHLGVALRYRPLLEAALNYLDKARSVENWKTRLVTAAKKYPQISATANYYYDGNSDWQVNPFVEAGFFTDQSCYSQLPSPWHHASMEEWYYLFWARRIQDGYLERAEDLLRLLIRMMNVYQ